MEQTQKPDELTAEWIPHMKAYRLFRADKPQSTIAYIEDLKDAQDRGYVVTLEGGAAP